MAKAILCFHKGETFFNGTTLAASYKLFQYATGTTTKTNTYTDSTKGTANSNPMTLDSDGRLAQNVYIDQAMRFKLAPSTDTDPPTAAIWDVDPISATEYAITTVSKTGNYTVLETDNLKLIRADATSAAFTITLLAAATAGDGFTILVKKVDSSTNAVTIDGNSSETVDGVATITLTNQNDSVRLICDGTNWQVVGSGHGFSEGITASGVNKLKATTSITGSGPVLGAVGPDTDISINITPKGAGTTTVTAGGFAVTAGSLSMSGQAVYTPPTTTVGAKSKLYEGTNNGTNYVEHKAADSLASSPSYIWPVAGGVAGQVLADTDGAGLLGWVAKGKLVGYKIATSSTTDTTTSGTLANTSLTTTYQGTTNNLLIVVATGYIIVDNSAANNIEVYGSTFDLRNTTTAATLQGSLRSVSTTHSASDTSDNPINSAITIIGSETLNGNSNTYALRFAQATGNARTRLMGATSVGLLLFLEFVV